MTRIRSTPRARCAAPLAIALAGVPALGGPDWEEPRIDAGPTPVTASKTKGVGSMGAISGTLGGGGEPGVEAASTGDHEDLYLIRIVDPKAFSARVGRRFPGDPVFNSVLTLFDAEGYGLLANDDDAGDGSRNARLLPVATDGSKFELTKPGLYYLGVSGSGDLPYSTEGAIFTLIESSEISGPDGPGAGAPVIRWPRPGDTGPYRIELTGVGYADPTADTNADGWVTIADLLEFLGLFRAGDADVTGDGKTTVQDLLGYLGLFRNG